MDKGGRLILLVLLMVTLPQGAYNFGFTAHRYINRMAVFSLPPSMIGLYKRNIEYITEHSIDPDRRVHVVEGEAPKHFINLELFPGNPFEEIPFQWNKAIEKYSEDTLNHHGILPWNIHLVLYQLTKAFEEQDIDKILYSSTNLGHYISDLCTPLHTTFYYNGRTQYQRGIHSLWETRLVELYITNLSFLAGRAGYIETPSETIWQILKSSHLAVDTILNAYDSLLTRVPADLIYSIMTRGSLTSKLYSPIFAHEFNKAINNMVERQMKLAIKTTADFWYTAWVNAGQPDLEKLARKKPSRAHRRQLKRELRKTLPLEITPDGI